MAEEWQVIKTIRITKWTSSTCVDLQSPKTSMFFPHLHMECKTPPRKFPQLSISFLFPLTESPPASSYSNVPISFPWYSREWHKTSKTKYIKRWPTWPTWQRPKPSFDSHHPLLGIYHKVLWCSTLTYSERGDLFLHSTHCEIWLPLHGLYLAFVGGRGGWYDQNLISQYDYFYITITIYSGYGKYSDPLKFFTLCYIAAIC